jgi:SAM-dependent methyltransferase
MPIIVRTRRQYEDYFRIYSSLTQGYREGMVSSLREETTISQKYYCGVCNVITSHHIDKQLAMGDELNYRERVFCQSCKLNSRWRAILETYDFFYGKAHAQVYMAEALSPLYKEFLTKFGDHASFCGSEFLSESMKPGEIHDGIQHENIQELSFANEIFDCVITNDVLEHIPEFEKALFEIFRVLKPGGRFLFTIPFHSELDHSRVRSKMNDGITIHLLDPIYHSNPIDENGSLVYTDFGWDLLERLIHVGFSDAYISVYQQMCAGHLGGNELVFIAIR